MKLIIELEILKTDENGDEVSTREPTKEEVKDFLERFQDMEDTAQDDAEGALWALGEPGSDGTQEEFDFSYPTEGLPSRGKIKGSTR